MKWLQDIFDKWFDKMDNGSSLYLFLWVSFALLWPIVAIILYVLIIAWIGGYGL